jgi:uncharacterized damage-inducible protein DinB
MSTFAVLTQAFAYYRQRTLGLLGQIEQLHDPVKVLGWRPGPGRAHIGWQLMHIGITEELFATERLAPDKPGAFTDLWPRFRGGSTPDDQIPTAEEIRRVLQESREHLLDTLTRFSEANLSEIPPALQQRQLTLLDVLHILGWHEAHHQGQAHITWNLYRAANAAGS